jgi:hypothetical protein
MPLAAVTVLKRGAVKEAVVVADDVALVRLFPLGEAAIGMKNPVTVATCRSEVTRSTERTGDQAFGDAAEDQAGLLVGSQALISLLSKLRPPGIAWASRS